VDGLLIRESICVICGAALLLIAISTEPSRSDQIKIKNQIKLRKILRTLDLLAARVAQFFAKS
jgi:hypothetical protein